jgi:hypothetical protein
MEKENKKVTRRKFLEDSSKKALAGTAAAFLGIGMIKPKAAQAAGCVFGCSWGCSASCGGCTGSCSGSCRGSCTGGCSSSCTSSCGIGCTGSCQGTCRTSGRSVSSAETACGTPVFEREISTRRVTV